MLKRFGATCRFFAAMVAVSLGLVVVSAASSEAGVTVTSLRVVVSNSGGTHIYCDDSNLACGGIGTLSMIWHLPLNGQPLADGQTLVLTQNQPGAPAYTQNYGFNFDSSEPAGIGCSSTTPCTTTVTITGLKADGVTPFTFTFGPSSTVINNLNNDTATPGNTHNEAANWALAAVGAPGTIRVSLGYADTLHAASAVDLCADANNACVPQNPWPGTATPPTFFYGSAAYAPFGGVGYIQGATPHCSVAPTGTPACYDGGALLITPEPALPPPPPPPGISHGCTPGFWKNHTNTPPWPSSVYTPTTKVQAVFTIPAGLGTAAQVAALNNETLLDQLQGGGGASLISKAHILLRAATAAVLNANNGNPPYPLTVAQIIAQTNAALATLDGTTITNLATVLDNYNNACDR